MLPLLATFLSARPGPRPSDDVVLPPLPVDARGGRIIDLPAGLPAGSRIRTPEDLRRLAVRALGAAGSDRLIELLDPAAPFVPDATFEGVGFPVPYPYRYPTFDEMLDRAPMAARTAAAAKLGAALVVLAARPTSDQDDFYRTEYRNAAAAAFALLDRARIGGDCEAQLNLLLLVAADSWPRDDVVQAEADRTASACPDDLTAYWLLGQFQSQRAEVESPHNLVVYPLPEDAMNRAPATFTALLERSPGAPAAWTGAADANARAGLVLRADQPFAARQKFRTAESQYRRAKELGAGREADIGRARVLIELGDPKGAVRLLQQVPAEGGGAGPVLELLTTAAEAGHDFDAARSHASRLTELGASAYPSDAPLFPVPGITPGPLFQAAATAPLSTGAGRLTPFTVDLAPEPGGAGGSVDDVSFIPVFRQDNFTGTEPMCPGWVWRRSAMLAGDAASALEDLPEEFRPVRPDLAHLHCGPGVGFRGVGGVLGLETGLANPTNPIELESLQDARQNLWRWAGDMARAEEVVREWADAAGPGAFLPMLRLGEVEYLRGQYDAAAADFDVAARRYRSAIDWAESRLDRGVALLRAGRQDEAIDLLRLVDRDAAADVVWSQTNAPSQTDRLVTLSFHARAQLADATRETGQLHASAEFYAAARERLPWIEERLLPNIRPERVYANEALTLLGLDRVKAAERSIDQALEVDPANPVFLMTAGFIAHRAGRTPEAADHNAAALRSDAGAYPAANDLGVELARLGDEDGALRAFRQAVAARPDYALGWFNLGVLHGRMGPLHLPASQGALARAITLDPSLADRERQLTIDEGIYRTGLDLSKPLPSRWSLADVQRSAPTAAAGLLAVCLLGLGLARTSVGDGNRVLLDKVVEPATDRLQRLPVVGRLRRPGWALAATPVVFLLAALHDVNGGATELFAYSLGVLVVVGLAMRARLAVARRAGLSAMHETWAPGVMFGMATGAAGLPWAPLPVVRTSDAGQRVHWAAPVVLALLGIVLFVEAAWLPLPLTRSLAVATLVMVASVLVPIAPLDGKETGKGGALVGVGVIGAAALVFLGLV